MRNERQIQIELSKKIKQDPSNKRLRQKGLERTQEISKNYFIYSQE